MKCLKDNCWGQAIPEIEYCPECAQKLSKGKWSVAKMQAYIRAVIMPRQHEREMNDPAVVKVVEAML